MNRKFRPQLRDIIVYKCTIDHIPHTAFVETSQDEIWWSEHGFGSAPATVIVLRVYRLDKNQARLRSVYHDRIT